jgi:Flp pilus assembly protein TadG
MSKREAGQALIMVTLSISVLLGMIGLAVDLGWSYYRRQAAQTAAESAATAAAVAAAVSSTISCNSTTAVCQGVTACPANPSTPPATNISSGCLYAQANGFLNTGSQTVQLASNLTAPPAVSGVATLYWVTATVTEQNPQLFSGILGSHRFGSVAAQATAGVFQGTVPTCVYVLEKTASQAFMASGSNSTLTTNCGLYVNSSSPSALTVNGQARVTAPVIDVVGGYSSCTNGQDCFYNPSLPLTGQSTQNDPYKNLAAPSYGSCGSSPSGSGSNLNLNQGSFTLNAGVYCGGITISGNAQVTLNPGTYILNGGGLTVNSANASITGSGVMFYNTANGFSYGPITLSGQPNVNLSAPTSGTYSGVLFYQDRTITSTTTNEIDGNTNPKMVGSLYFPTTPLTISGGASPTPFVGKLIARTLTVNGNSGLFVTEGGPTTSGGATKVTALIQ